MKTESFVVVPTTSRCGDVYYNNVELWICEKGGYLAVPSQPKKYGYIFKDCTIKDATATKDLNGNYTLGRPWAKGTPIAPTSTPRWKPSLQQQDGTR